MNITIDIPEEWIQLHEKWVRIKMQAYDDDLCIVSDAITEVLRQIKMDAFHLIVKEYNTLSNPDD